MAQNNSLFKNTIALYIRMLFSVCINVYISRVILDVLGVEDFGVYSVVGGVVVLLGFINSSMSGSTSRFLSVAIGEGNSQKLVDTYNAAKHLHFGVAILIFLLGESFGSWIVNGYLEIPQGRLIAANVVYQLSLITILFTIVQVPFSALVISMERMDVYAKIEIANVLLKLAIVLILPYCLFDKLILYSSLLLVAAFFIYIIYRRYCNDTYKSLQYDKKIRMDIIRPMLVYSGWDMLGWGGVSMSTQGRQIFINKFFGVSLNAANGLASTASGAIQAFTNNIIMAFRPRITKCYAAKDYIEMQRLTELALTATIILMSIIFVPMVIGMDYLLNVWLVEVPPLTLEFCRLLLILQFLEAINTVVKIGIQASGILKNFTIISFIIHLLNLILTYIFYLIGMSPSVTYFVAIGLCFANIAVNFCFLRNIIKEIIIGRFVLICFKGIVVCIGAFLLGHLIDTFIKGELASFMLVFVSSSIAIIIFSFLLYYSTVKMVVNQFFAKKQCD